MAQRILIIGCPGSGKSTLARALQAKMGLPLYPLDLLYWKEDKTKTPREEFRSRLREILATDAWIIDGNYASTMELRMQFCDTVILLDFPTEVCLRGIRERLGKPRPDMPWVETEEDSEFMDYVSSFQTTNRPAIYELLSRYPSIKQIVLRSRKEADDFLQEPERYL